MVKSNAVSAIVPIVESVANAFLGGEIRIAKHAEVHSHHASELFVGCVSIRGQWCGAITVTCSRALAMRAAAAMFASSVEQVSEDDANDAIGELTNILGGNFKAIVAMDDNTPYQLSLPIVSKGAAAVPGTSAVEHVCLMLDGHPLCVEVLEVKEDD